MTYKHYNLTKTDAGVEVRDPRRPDKLVYLAADTARAKRFVTAYRDGTYWAVMEALA